MDSANDRRKVIVVIYEYFYPGYLAGGPIQSLRNMVTELGAHYEFKIITSAFDLTATKPYADIRIDAWNRIQLPDSANEIQVWYNDSLQIGRSKLLELIQQSQADVVFINGLFTRWSTWPLVLKAARLLKTNVVVSPRGMLQEGALNVKPVKKKLFLNLLKPAFRGVDWHATDEQEQRDIRLVFGDNSKITVAANIPKHPLQKKRSEKIKGHLRLVFLSLITEKKNLHLVLEALKLIKTPVSLDIFGPVKDENYWQQCLALVSGQAHDVNYQGAISPNEVQEKLAEYDAFILPTKGENFGHAIYEALSVGTPVIISPYTPWKVDESGAGKIVKTEKPEDWAAAIQEFVQLDEGEHQRLTTGAFEMAEKYFKENDFVSQYKMLFG